MISGGRSPWMSGLKNSNAWCPRTTEMIGQIFSHYKITKKLALLICGAVVLVGCGEPTVDAPAWVDGVRIENADSEPHNWLTHGRTYSEQRYSPLDQINDSSVDRLGLAWHYDLDTNRGQQASPIVVDGVMYTTSAWSKVQALNAGTGELLWQFDPEVPGAWAIKSCCGVQNRGAAVWMGRVYVGTLDGRLIALDAETGEVEWETLTIDPSKRYSITGAPRIVKGKVVIGNGGAEYGVRGYVTAYDAATGEQVWRFYTVPGNPADGFENQAMEMAARTWTGEWWEHGGGGTAWDSFAYDPELELLYIGTGNGSPWPRAIRSPGGGDNLFLASIVAVRPDSGEYVWHYQIVPGNSWDYTATQHMILADLEIEGRLRQVIMQAPKNGFFYVLDRETGELISAEKFMPNNWASHVDIDTGRPVETSFARYDETGKPAKIVPGPIGAHNWQPMAFNPLTGIVYIPALQSPMVYNLDNSFKPKSLGANNGLNYWDEVEVENELGPEFGEDVQGLLLAWDPVAQREVWRKPHKAHINGGVLSTAGNLVFQGTAERELVAYRADGGERLWAAPTRTGVIAPPVTYEIGGEQYIAVVVGWGSAAALLAGPDFNPEIVNPNISRVLAFKLGGRGELPPAPKLPARPTPPPDIGNEATVQKGKMLYGKFCFECHGFKAVAGGVVPDLRYSVLINDTAAFDMIVRGGTLEERGMVSFAEVLDETDVEALRAYIIRRANESIDQR